MTQHDLPNFICYDAAMKPLSFLIITLLCALGTSLAAQVSEPVATTESQAAAASLTGAEKALIESAYKGNLSKVQELLAKGVSVSTVDIKKRTALMWAALNGHTPVVEYLHGKGGDINAKDSDSQTALMLAVEGSFPQTVEYLLKNGAEVNVQSRKQGFTALIIAAAIGNVEIVGLLLASGADADMKDKDGFTAERIARQYEYSAVITLLENPTIPAENP